MTECGAQKRIRVDVRVSSVGEYMNVVRNSEYVYRSKVNTCRDMNE